MLLAVNAGVPVRVKTAFVHIIIISKPGVVPQGYLISLFRCGSTAIVDTKFRLMVIFKWVKTLNESAKNNDFLRGTGQKGGGDKKSNLSRGARVFGQAPLKTEIFSYYIPIRKSLIDAWSQIDLMSKGFFVYLSR
jgi:hypothetical protein